MDYKQDIETEMNEYLLSIGDIRPYMHMNQLSDEMLEMILIGTIISTNSVFSVWGYYHDQINENLFKMKRHIMIYKWIRGIEDLGLKIMITPDVIKIFSDAHDGYIKEHPAMMRYMRDLADNYCHWFYYFKYLNELKKRRNQK